MSESSSIQWTDATWSPITGCTRVSEGCRNCYAERLTATRLRQNPKYVGLAAMTQSGPRWTNEIRLNEDELLKPLGWKKPRRIFVNSMSDTFHEKVPFEFIDKLFAVMALCPQHTFQVLTKRPERMAEYLTTRDSEGWIADALSNLIDSGKAPRVREWVGTPSLAECSGDDDEFCWPLPNVWLGTSVEDQKTADERIPYLLRCPAAVRFLSCEPLLGSLDLARAFFADCDRCDGQGGWGDHDPQNDEDCPDCGGSGCDDTQLLEELHWVIIGGESGPGARSMVCGHAKEIVRQCKAAGVPVFMKQLGAKPVNREGVVHPVGDRHGSNIEEFPEELRVREFPGVPA